LPEFTRQSLRRRFPALAAAAALHGVFVLLILHAMPPIVRDSPRKSESIILLPPLQPAAKKPPRGAGADISRSRYYYHYNFRPSPAPNAPAAAGADAAALANLNAALNACDISNLANLPQEARVQCRVIHRALYAMRDAMPEEVPVEGEKRWRRELAVKNSALLLPCASPYGVDVLFTLFCLADMVSSHYDPDKMQHYEPEKSR
jgi:hypothetical protein